MNKPDEQQVSGLDPETEKLRQRMESLAWLLDNSIRIPVIGYRIGLDAILGLIPGVGDATGALLSSYIFYSAIRMKAPISVLGRMGFNILFELVFGIIPVIGDIFDMAFKANERNMRLVNAWLDRPKKTRRESKLLLGGIGGGLGLLLVGGFLAGVFLLILMIRLISRLF